MGKNAQRDAKREEALGLRQAGLKLGHVEAMNNVSHAKFRVGVGVLVQEEDKATSKATSIATEIDRIPRWRVLKRRPLIRAWRQALAERDLWAGRLKQVTDEVARLASGKDMAIMDRRR